MAAVAAAGLALIAVTIAEARVEPEPVRPVTLAPMIVMVPEDAEALVKSQDALATAGVAPVPLALPSPSWGRDAALAGTDIYAEGYSVQP